MRRTTRSALVAVTALTAALGFTAASASATTQAATWTAAPGGDIVGTADTPTMEVPAMTLSCESSEATGTVKSGSGLEGAGIADITGLTFAGCTLPGLSFDVTMSGFPFKLNTESVDPDNPDRVIGNLSGIEAHIEDSTGLCTADFAAPDGSAATVEGYYDNSTGELVINAGNLTAANADCLGLLDDGDAADFQATYAVDPAQTITLD